VLGSSGMIGHQVYNLLQSKNEFILFDLCSTNKLSEETILVDVRDFDLLTSTIKEIQPNIIINCVGTLIKESEENPELAIYTNSLLPYQLKKLADEIDCRLIHLSTDCVFSGNKVDPLKPYIETDLRDGYDVYAKTKGLGEVFSKTHLTVRTSVVGPELREEGEQLFNWFMKQTKEVQGFADAIWSGVTSLELAKAVYWLIEAEVVGLYQVTNGKPISKNELLTFFKDSTKKDIKIKPLKGININKHFIDTRKLLDYKIPEYEDMISEMITDIVDNPLRYPHYNIAP